MTPPFGVYLADNIQMVQLIFLANCRDENSTRFGLQRLFEWLASSDEDENLAHRASARAKIAKTIAKERQALGRE